MIFILLYTATSSHFIDFAVTGLSPLTLFKFLLGMCTMHSPHMNTGCRDSNVNVATCCFLLRLSRFTVAAVSAQQPAVNVPIPRALLEMAS